MEITSFPPRERREVIRLDIFDAAPRLFFTDPTPMSWPVESWPVQPCKISLTGYADSDVHGTNQVGMPAIAIIADRLTGASSIRACARLGLA